MSAATYPIHCYTYRVARTACGLRATPGTGRTSWPVGPPGAGLTTFRARPPDRNACGQHLRDEVAALVRMERAVARLVGLPAGSLLTPRPGDPWPAPPPPRRPGDPWPPALPRAHPRRPGATS